MSIKSVPAVKNIAWTFWLGVMFFIVVLIGLIFTTWGVTEHVTSQEGSPVTSLIVTGEMPFTKEEEVISAIEQVDLGNFFQVDVNEVQAYVSKLPWVYSVSVRKHWPNELKIYVVDQDPVALWNGDFLLNQQGVAFQADISRLHNALPMFFGPEGSEIVALENFINFNSVLEYKSLAIDELVLSERFAWQLTLNDGVTLNLGREESIKRIQRFMDVYPKIKAQLVIKNSKRKANKKSSKHQLNSNKEKIDYVDLRYDTGLAVGWKLVESAEQSS